MSIYFLLRKKKLKINFYHEFIKIIMNDNNEAKNIALNHSLNL